MGSSWKLLVLSSVLYLASATASTILAIKDHLPAQFGGILRGDNVAIDFLTWMGTAISPPMVMLLAQIVFTICALQAGRAGAVGIAGLTVLGGMYTMGQLGEPILGRAFAGSTSGWVVVILVANIVCSLLMLIFGAISWRTRQSASRATEVV
jgi:hypothetical protein